MAAATAPSTARAVPLHLGRLVAHFFQVILYAFIFANQFLECRYLRKGIFSIIFSQHRQQLAGLVIALVH